MDEDIKVMVALADKLVRANIALPGERGLAWLDRLSEIITGCERRWSVRIGPPFEGLSYNYAAPGTLSNGTPVVLKVCFPAAEVLTEIEALRFYNGEGAVRLIESDIDEGVMLLERVVPGDMLIEVESEAESNRIAATVMKDLWKPVPAQHPIPSIDGWGRGFQRLRERSGRTTGPFPQPITEKAERLFAQLCASSAQPVVLHGDLHHFNILRQGEGRWLAIDPKGVVGEPAYEIGALMRNRLPDLSDIAGSATFLSRRITSIAQQIELDAERLRLWSVAQAILSAWWNIEDGGDYDDDCREMVALAEVLDTFNLRGGELSGDA